MRPLRVGVVGAGYFGSLHASKYYGIADAELVAVCDIIESRARAVASKFGAKPSTDWQELIGEVDAVSIVVPTCSHFDVAREFLTRGIHVLVEKPICESLEQADELIDTAHRVGVVLQVGHLERFNPAIKSAALEISNPRYIESRRFCRFVDRNMDTNVVLDLMIHDLDLILSMVNAPIKEISAFGGALLSNFEDMVNARIEFANGCVATFTANRTSDSPERSITVLQAHDYLTIDLLENKISKSKPSKTRGSVSSYKLETVTQEFGSVDVLQSQLFSFTQAVLEGREPEVKANDAWKALEAAIMINSKFETPLKIAVA